MVNNHALALRLGVVINHNVATASFEQKDKWEAQKKVTKKS